MSVCRFVTVCVNIAVAHSVVAAAPETAVHSSATEMCALASRGLLSNGFVSESVCRAVFDCLFLSVVFVFFADNFLLRDRALLVLLV